LNANFVQPVIQITNNPLVVDTAAERILVDTGFGENIGPSFGSFPRLEANLRRAGMMPESIDLVVISHGHLDHIGGLVTNSGALAFPNAQFVFVDTEWNYWTGSRYKSEVDSSPMPDPFTGKPSSGPGSERTITPRRRENDFQTGALQNRRPG
jgi:glyoxylase-like metal-dependent hydrolase (beta-lactamase superfamily II)